MNWTEAKTALRITWREYQISYRGAAFWAVAAAGAVLAFWRASLPNVSAALAAYQTLQVVLFGVATIAILVGGAAASRDRRDAASELVLAKPMGSTAYLVLARFVGLWLSLITIVAVMLVVALIRQVAGGTPWHIGAYLNALARSLVPIGLAAALGYSLTTLFISPLAAGIAAVYWVSVPLARAHIPWVADLTPTQHWPLAALLAAGLLALASARYGSWLQSAGRGRAGLGWAAAACFAGTLLLAFATALDGEDTLTARDPVLSAIAAQRALEGERAPGFWLRDGRGRLLGLDDFRGRAIALGFWGPGDPESLRLLSTLEELAQRIGPQGLTCIAVCVDRDSASVGPFAREHPHLVLLWDRGQHYGDGERWSDSPLGIVYEVREVPVVFLLDRQRTYLSRVEGHSLQTLEAAISRMLESAERGEPARPGEGTGGGRQWPGPGVRAPAMRGR